MWDRSGQDSAVHTTTIRTPGDVVFVTFSDLWTVSLFVVAVLYTYSCR